MKNQLLTPRRTWDRKLREAVLALLLEWRHDKTEILEAYLNSVYLGQHGSVAVSGVGAAARSYFGKDVEAVTVAEAALLAAMIRAPNSYSPARDPGRARERRDLVLARMRALGFIDATALATALRERVEVRPAALSRQLGPYFLDSVRGEVEQRDAAGNFPTGGLRIYTTLDPVLQRAAEAALARGLDGLETRFAQLRRSDGARLLQGALVALDPTTGEIRAMVGGREYMVSQFNRVTHARRQPGSAFKPFVYLAALGAGPQGERPRFTPASLVDDRPLAVGDGPDAWSPRNYADRFEGTVSVRRALEQSLNAATVRVAEAVGRDAVIRSARLAGFTSPMAAVPALSLGSFEVTPLELAAAYASLANGGARVTPTGIRVVVDRDGGLLDQTTATPVPAFRAGEAFLVTHLLQGVIDRGTGSGARALGVQGPLAGKTGTTNDGRDAWFVGYTPRLVVVVWVGFDQADVTSLSGSQAALPIWADFMRTATAVLPGAPFGVPSSVVFREVNPANGKLASRFCPIVLREAFLAGTEPHETCPDHDPLAPVRSLLRRFLDLFR